MEQYLPFASAHPALMAALAVSFMAIVANEIFGVLTAGKTVSAPEAVRLMNDRDARVIDVRPVADFKKAHLLGALNIPHDKLKDRLGELERDKSKPVIVYCALGGGSSRESAKLLREKGFAEAFPLSGGLNGWLGASLPVTTK
jgi:rhodanese-related sulfurtransferase